MKTSDSIALATVSLFEAGECPFVVNGWQQLEMVDLRHVCTDYYPAYRRIVPKDMHGETKSETAAIEGLNSRIRHYLARFHRKLD